MMMFFSSKHFTKISMSLVSVYWEYEKLVGTKVPSWFAVTAGRLRKVVWSYACIAFAKSDILSYIVTERFRFGWRKYCRDLKTITTISCRFKYFIMSDKPQTIGNPGQGLPLPSLFVEDWKEDASNWGWEDNSISVSPSWLQVETESVLWKRFDF